MNHKAIPHSSASLRSDSAHTSPAQSLTQGCAATEPQDAHRGDPQVSRVPLGAVACRARAGNGSGAARRSPPGESQQPARQPTPRVGGGVARRAAGARSDPAARELAARRLRRPSTLACGPWGSLCALVPGNPVIRRNWSGDPVKLVRARGRMRMSCVTGASDRIGCGPGPEQENSSDRRRVASSSALPRRMALEIRPD